MTKKRLILIASLLAAAVVVLLLYFLWIRPLTVGQEEAPDGTQLSSGEVSGGNGRILMFAQVPREQMASVRVHNQTGDYALVRNSAGSFCLEDHPNAVLDGEKLSSFIVDVGYPLTMSRVAENAAADFAKYGLDDEETLSYYELTTTAGTVHRVWVGDMIPSLAGYYVRYEGRDTVYILGSGLGNTVLAPETSLVSGLLAYPGNLNYYYLASNFTVMEGDAIRIYATYLNEDERSDLHAMTVHQILAPVVMGASAEYDGVLQTFVELVADEVLEVGLDDEKLAKYDLTEPKYMIGYTGGYVRDDGSMYTVNNIISVSEKTADGYYYVASPLFDIIGRVKAGTFDFLDWELINWVDTQFFAVAISKVSQIDFIGGADEETYLLSRTADNSMTVRTGEGKLLDLANFKQLYLGMLNLTLEGYTGLTEDQVEEVVSDPARLITKIRVTANSGDTLEFGFYRYSEVRALVTITENGERNSYGEFYVPVVNVKKLVSDVTRLRNGETVVSGDRY